MDHEKALAERARRRVRDEFDWIPEDRAQFIWHHDQVQGEWKNGAFVVVPLGMMGDELQPLSSSTGADTEGWPDKDHNNPEFVFGSLLMEPWISRREQIEMIAEFGKIDSAEWARRMLRGIALSLGAFPEGDERSLWDPMTRITDVEMFRDEIIHRLAEREQQDREHAENQ